MPEKYYCTPTAHQLYFVVSIIYASHTVLQSEVSEFILSFYKPFSPCLLNALFAQSALFCTEISFGGVFFPVAVSIALQLTLLKLSGRHARRSLVENLT